MPGRRGRADAVTGIMSRLSNDIVGSFAMFRQLIANDGGSVTFDASTRSLTYAPPVPR